MNYTALQAAVASYLHRTDATLDTNIALWIEMARLRIGRDVRGLANLKTATVTSFSSEASALPADLGRLRTVSIDGVAMEPISSDSLGAWQNTSSFNVYAVRGQYLVVPGSDASTSVLLEYWSIPAALSAGGDISAGMAEWPHIWIQAAVIEAAYWERDWDLYNQLIPLYDAEVKSINAQCQEQLFGNAPAVISDQPMIFSAGWQ